MLYFFDYIGHICYYIILYRSLYCIVLYRVIVCYIMLGPRDEDVAAREADDGVPGAQLRRAPGDGMTIAVDNTL